MLTKQELRFRGKSAEHSLGFVYMYALRALTAAFVRYDVRPDPLSPYTPISFRQRRSKFVPQVEHFGHFGRGGCEGTVTLVL